MKQSRFARVSALLDRRQSDLTVVMDQVHKPMNMAAIMRTCDAVGIPKVHAIWPERQMRISGNTASGSQRWVDIEIHRQADACLSALKQQGMQLLVTHLSPSTVDFRQIDYTRPTAIVVGHERLGASAEMLAQADHTISIPMLGAVQSLNVSAATAVILYEAQRQRQQAGLYDTPRPLAEDQRRRILFNACHPTLAKRCRAKQLAYPQLDHSGEIIASEQWWQQLRDTRAKP